MGRGTKSLGSLFVNLLGGFRVAGPQAEDVLVLDRKKTRALLAILALDPGRMMSRAKLTALLWSEQREDTARHGLRQCLLDLRRALAKGKVDAICAEGDVVGLERSRIVVDVARFDQLAGQGAHAALEQAMDLYHGDLLEGFTVDEEPFEAWLRVERERLRSRAVGVLRKLLAEHVRANAIDAAVRAATRLLTFEPYDEATHRTLMRLYAESGRRSSALRQYEICVELLGRELNVEPETETRELYRRLVSKRDGPAKAPTKTRLHGKPGSRAVRAQGPYPSPAATPLIGRESDVAWLEALWRRARNGEPQLALVIGDAGIGKTRFIGELTSRDEYRRASFLLGRGREGEDVLAFAPWAEALRPVLSDELLDQLAPVTRLDLARLFPEIAGGSGPPPGGVEDGIRIFEAVANLLRRVAAGRPLVVLLEDLHWCDDMTVRLLKFLPRRLEGRPVLLVGTARAEEISGISGRGAVLDALRRDVSSQSRTLGPLSRDQSMELLQLLLASRGAGTAAALADRVWQLSEGNPFVVVECARAFRDGRNETSEFLWELPDQVRALTTRYLTDLGDVAVRLVDAAAVIGRDFDMAVLRHVADLSPSEVADGLEQLVRRRVLREAQGRFDFVHDRIREVAYSRLLGPRRVFLHGRIGQAMEAVYAADLRPHRAIIGAHYRRAEVWPQACEYEAQAGFDALERGAGREALACFQHALQALTQLPKSNRWNELNVRLRLAVSGTGMTIGNYEYGRPYLLEAQRVAETLADRRWQGHVAAAMASCARPAGDLVSAVSFGQQALEIANEVNDHPLEVVARFILACSESNAGNFRRSLEHLTILLRTDGGDSDATFGLDTRPYAFPSVVRYWMTSNYLQLGEFTAAMRLVEEWTQRNALHDDLLGTHALLLHISQGKLQNAIGNFEIAVAAFETAVAAYRDDCHGHFHTPSAWGLGLAYALAGRISHALVQFERAEAHAEKIGSTAYMHTRLRHVACGLIEAGRYDEAARMATEAITLSRKGGIRPVEAGALALLGEIAKRQGQPNQEMERRVLDALALAETLEMRPLAARCHLLLAWLYDKRDRPPERENHATAARSLIQQIGCVKLDAAGVI